MALWDKLKTELDRAGRAAQTAFDEGKVRLEVLRVRQLADKAAQALGYAVYRARQGGGELDAETYARLSSTLAAHEAEVQRLEAQLAAARAATGDTAGGTASTAYDPAGGAPAADHPSSSTGAPAAAAGGEPGTADATAGMEGTRHHEGIDPALGDVGRGGSPHAT